MRITIFLILLSLLGGCASLPTLVDRQESFVLEDKAETELAKSVQKRTSTHPGQSGFLLRAGIELYEIDKTLTRQQQPDKKGPRDSSKASLHAKSFVIDGKRVFVGSMNQDPRSIVENTEIGMMIESTAIAERINDWFDTIVTNTAFRLALEKIDDDTDALVWHRSENGKSRVYTTEPNTGFWRRFNVRILRILAIESLL